MEFGSKQEFDAFVIKYNADNVNFGLSIDPSDYNVEPVITRQEYDVLAGRVGTNETNIATVSTQASANTNSINAINGVNTNQEQRIAALEARPVAPIVRAHFHTYRL